MKYQEYSNSIREKESKKAAKFGSLGVVGYYTQKSKQEKLLKEQQKKLLEDYNYATTPANFDIKSFDPKKSFVENVSQNMLSNKLQYSPIAVEGAPVNPDSGIKLVSQEVYDAAIEDREKQETSYHLLQEMNTAKYEWENARDFTEVEDFLNYLAYFESVSPKDIAKGKYYSAAEAYYQNLYDTDADLTTIFNSLKSQNTNNAKQDEQIQDLSELLYGKSAIDNYLGNNIMAGIGGLSYGTSSTLDATVGNVLKLFGWENNPVSSLNKQVKSTYDFWITKSANSAVAIGDPNNWGGIVIQGLVGLVPDIWLAMQTGGASLPTSSTLKVLAGNGIKATTTSLTRKAATLQGKLSPIVSIANKSKVIANAAATTLKTAATNPMYWTSFTRTFGTDYETAKEKGANEATAYLYALVTSTMNSLVEVGGGVQVLPSKLQGKSKSQIFEWIKSSLEEGAEEVVQGVISEMNEKLMYDYDKEIFSLVNEDAIINPKRMGTEFAVGTAVGLIAGGGQVIADNISTAQYTKLGTRVRNNVNIGDLLSYAQKSSNENIRTIARENTADKISNKNLGILYSYAVRDVDTAFNSVSDIEGINRVLGEFVQENNSQTFNNIVFSRYVNRLDSIDPQTVSGYNNNTNINQDKGGIEDVTSDRLGENSEVKNQHSEANAGTEGEGRRTRSENERDFIRRITETSQKSRRKIRSIGKSFFAYTPKDADGSQASKAVEILNKAGINAVYCEGNTESNADGATTLHTEAVTAPDGTIYVSDSSSLSSIQIAAHEAVHYHQKNNTAEYAEYQSIICDNVLWGTDEYLFIAKQIFNGHHRMQYENKLARKLTDNEINDIINSPEYGVLFLIEFTAYVNEAISANSTETIEMFSKVFSNWDAVVEASRKFNEAIGIDFSSADTATESSPIDSQSTDTDSETAPTGITELSAADAKKDAFKLAMEDVTGYKELTEEQKIIRNIGHQLGWKVEFGPVRTPKGRKADGKISFATKTITIDPTSKKPIQFILKHELAHSLEQNKAAYAELQNAIMDSKVFKDYVKAQGFASVSDYNADIVARYKAEGVKGFDSTRAEYKANCEMVANFVGDCLFGGNTEVTVKLFEGMNNTQRRSFIAWVKDFFAKVKGKLSGKHNGLTDEISKLEDAFLKTLNSVETKENTAENDGESYSLGEYSEHQKENWSKSKKIVIFENEKGLLDFVNKCIFDTSYKAKMYFGTVTESLANRIENETGLDLLGRNVTLRADNIRKILKPESHGDAAREKKKHQFAVDKTDFIKIVDVIGSPDTIRRSEQDYEGKPTIVMAKTFGEQRVTVIAVDSGGSLDLFVQTMYIGKNKENITDMLNGETAEQTSKTTVGTVPKYSIPNSDENVNYSISEPSKVEDILAKFKSGEITQEDAVRLLSKDKTMTPYDIAHLKPRDADITAEDGTPKMQGEGNRESKLYQSLLNSEIITEDVKKEIEADTYIKNYQGTTNKRTLKIAAEELAEGGMAKVQEWHQLKAEKASAVDVAIGLILLERYQRAGRTQSAVLVAEKLREIGTSAGQTVQIFSIIGRFNPEMMQAYAQKELDTAYEALVEAKTQKWAEKHKDRFKLTEEDIEFIRRRTLQAAILEDGTRQKSILLAEICTRIQDKLPPEAGQSLRALQRISLLLNVRTNLRNIVGNANMVPVFIASDFFGSLLDKHLAKKTGVRTTGNFQIKGSGEAFKKGLAESYDDFKRGIRTKQDELNRYDVNRGGGKSFNEHHKKLKQLDAVSKALNKLDNFTSFCLEAGDRGFFEMWFQNALNNQMRLNNVEIPTENMINIAREEALQRTWQDNNTVTRTMSRLKNTLNKAHIPLTSYGFGDFVLKFVKTPANIGKAMVQFSPLGFTSAITKGIKFKDALETGNLTPQMQKDFVSSMSNAFVGTVLYALVALLASTGAIALTGAGDEDKDVSNFEKYIVGVPPYSMKIFGVDVTYSWNQPMGTIFATVADIMDSKKDGTNASWYEDAWNAFKAGATVFTEQSFLSSLYELFSADDITTGFAEAFLSEPSAFIPQIVSQVASFTDPYRRTTYENGQPIQSAINSIIYKIPGLRQKLPAQVNVLGETVENVQYLNPWEAFANPSTTYPESSGAVAEEIYELYKVTGDKKVMPRVAPNKVTIKGINISFTAEEKADFQRSMGTCSVELLKAVFDSKGYAALSDEEKIKAVAKAYEYAYAKAKTELDIFDYELLSAMEGTKTNGVPILSKNLYNRLDAKAKQILIDEYFFSKAEMKCRGDAEKLAELFVKQVKD